MTASPVRSQQKMKRTGRRFLPYSAATALLGGCDKDTKQPEDNEDEDRWQRYPEQREDIPAFIEQNQIFGIPWFAGDFHYGKITRIGGGGDLDHNLHEVLARPSGSYLNPIGCLAVTTDQYLLSFSE